MRGSNGNMMLMNADGGDRTSFQPEALNLFTMSNCADRYILFDAFKGSELWRTDGDGNNPTRLADEVFDSDCSPDGKWVLYSSSRVAVGTKLHRLPVEGGRPTEVAMLPENAVYIGHLAISPDGEWMSYDYLQLKPEIVPKLAITTAASDLPVQVLTEPADAQGLQWSPDGKGLQYLLTRKGATNVWEQRLAGGEPKQVTNFTSGQIFDFAWTRDGKKLPLLIS